MDTILLMLSGGVDSTCLLYYYLTETEYPVHVHHISLRYPTLQRWKMEDPAVERILDYCRREYRPFEYSESRFDTGPLNFVGYDQTVQLLVASKVAPNLPGDRVTLALGNFYGEFDSPEGQELVERKTMHRLWQALRESCANQGEKLNPERARPFIDLKWTKEEICRSMPAPLMQLCWSCRRPDYIGGEGIPCGICKTCMQLEEILGKMGQAAKFPNLIRSGHAGGPGMHKKALHGHRPNLPKNNPFHHSGHDSMAGVHCAPMPTGQGVPETGGAYCLEFQVKVALAALKNGSVEARIARQFGITATMVKEWKELLLSGIASRFSQKTSTTRDQRQLEAEIESLNGRIQQLEAQMNCQPMTPTVSLLGDGEF